LSLSPILKDSELILREREERSIQYLKELSRPF
jgi:hypothetical protein